jgi:hypothetical protein
MEENLPQGAEQISRFESNSILLKELKEDYNNNARFLVGYDKQKYLNVCKITMIIKYFK